MRRYTFYLSIALLAFGIGLSFVFKDQKQAVTKVLITEKIENFSKKPEKKKYKYGCEEKELESFWEKLDEESFFRVIKAQLKAQYRRYPDSFEAEWALLNQRFHCKSFTNLERLDLNNDGIEEISVRDENLTLRDDKPLFVFRELNGKWQLILYDLMVSDFEVTKRKDNEYPQITVKSGYFRDGSVRINRFQFNGKFYKSVKCINKNEWIDDVNGNIINLRKPLIKSCD